MTIQMSVSIPTQSNLSSIRTLTCLNQMHFLTNFSQLSLNKISTNPLRTSIIRMGGGPRTFPGGVSKWQWKRMQQKKAKQLLKARLCREKQIYEMRKRAELRAAVSELEKPWEIVEKSPALFSVRADEQVKVLADRFQRPGGYDLWSDNDGPQLFQHSGDDFPSARFFPKGVVHSIKPYESIRSEENSDDFKGFKEFTLPNGKRGKGSRRFRSRGRSESESEGGEDGELELSISSYSNAGKRPSSENSGLMGRREEDSSISGRGMSREFNLGRPEEGSSRGSSRRKGSRGNLGSQVTYGLNSDNEEKNEFPFMGRGRGRGRGRGPGPGRGGSDNERPYDTRRGLWKPSDLSGEIYDMSLKQDGTYEL